MRLALLAALPLLVSGSVFDTPELQIKPSPAQAVQIRLPDGLRVIDCDVSPRRSARRASGLRAGGTAEDQALEHRHGTARYRFDVPQGFNAKSIAWHPLGEVLFLSGAQGQDSVILKLEKENGAWTARSIYTSHREIRRLVPGPRPFIVAYDQARQKAIQSYRLFFGLKAGDGTWSIHSITEEGRRDYQVVGHRQTFTRFANEDRQPSELAAVSALPVGFHPAGHLLVWEDGARCFQVASYDRDYWKKTAPLLNRNICGGSVGVTPNGAALLHWTPDSDGVELVLDRGALTRREAAGYRMIATPSSVADGKGIVGITRAGVGLALAYVPIHVPMADSVNAWMYLESGRDQLYQLYDTESYYCGNLDESTPTRPYLASDAFWELFAAAYEGIFIVQERQNAIPAFRQFVDLASAALARSYPQSGWTKVFAALAAVPTKPETDDEARRILNATDPQFSPVLGVQFDYGELKPRGHYAATPEGQRYFRAFRYLTKVSSLPNWKADHLQALPPNVKAAALSWISSYQSLIAPSRSPLLWQTAPSALSWLKHPQANPVLFPLSWGFDNEALYSTIYHSDLPPAEQIDGPAGRRLQPSSLDVAAALGSRFARGLLADEIRRYPKLDAALNDLNARSSGARGESGLNLYQRWLDALAQQWADSTPSPNGALDQDLWRAKRLQTGLASWATLRHATVLVNERVGAECGEGGFEFIVLRPPRGYVEPDPQTFGKIAGLFDAAAKLVADPGSSLAGALPQMEGEYPQARESLKQGLLRRLAETAAKARLFRSMANKEVRGEPLTAQEYEDILYFGRVAEHHFLVYKSLANKDLALSTPNPIPKIADISDVLGHAPYLMAAVDRPLEWDHTVPFFGRHEIVKGAAYSFYEFSSNTLLNDADWIKKLPAEPHPAWIAPYVSQKPLSCPPRDPF